MKADYQVFAEQKLPKLEQVITQNLARTVSQEDLRTAMSYSIGVGGKRLRPLLLMSVVASFQSVDERVYLPAAALELVHTYSLIHDDLPAMDDDDYRRGQLSNHKKFGVGQAILAGDGLLTVAFEWLSHTEYSPETQIQLVRILSHAAGPSEMVAGQYTDIEKTSKKVGLSILETMELQKTAALINAAVLMGATIAGVSKVDYQSLDTFSTNFGLAFQIADDINDYEDGQDTEEKKATFVTMLGLTEAKSYLNKTLHTAKEALQAIENQDLSLLMSYFKYFRQVK